MLSQQGHFKCYSLLGTLSSTTRSETKLWPRDMPTLKFTNEACALTIEHSVFSYLAGLIVEILLYCSLFVMLHNGLKMSE